MKLVLASRNADKHRELARLLAPHELLDLPAGVVLPPETGSTFAENAAAKARAAARATGMPAIADDSGIEATALGGAPGIRSARYAGETASDELNLAKLLEELALHNDRRVAYVCALAYATPGGELRGFQARCEGRLAIEPAGTDGFGYDPAFIPAGDGDGDGRTMAQLAAHEKDAISHRGRAARLFLDWLESGPQTR